MEQATARARLKAMTAADSAPVLSADELSSLLSLSTTLDAAGRAPTDTAWVETYDLNRAAAEGWRWKAAKLAAAYDFTADGATYNRSQAVEQCQKMVAQYAGRVVSSIPVYAALAVQYPEDDEV